MLLPIAPAVVTKVHDDKDFADANYYHQFFCKQLRDQEQELQELLETLERRRKQQQQQQQQQQQLYQQLQLLLTPNDSCKFFFFNVRIFITENFIAIFSKLSILNSQSRSKSY